MAAKTAFAPTFLRKQRWYRIPPPLRANDTSEVSCQANDTSEVSLARPQVGQSRRAKTRAPGPQSALKNNRVEKN